MSDEKRVERKFVLKALEEVDRIVVALSRAGLKREKLSAISTQLSATGSNTLGRACSKKWTRLVMIYLTATRNPNGY